jgi:phosphatidylserine decarboxylase
MRFAPGAVRLGLLAASVTLLASFVLPVGIALVPIAFLAGLYFLRDPERVPADGPDGEGVLAPADGRVSVIREESGRLRVGVFMNVTDVHVNRAPLAGTVESVVREPGANKPAFSKDSDRNEKVHVECGDYTVTLIAGWFARRITTYPEPGAELARGERVGHIDFGSRADVLFPPEYDEADLEIGRGDAVRAGETVLARR